MLELSVFYDPVIQLGTPVADGVYFKHARVDDEPFLPRQRRVQGRHDDGLVGRLRHRRPLARRLNDLALADEVPRSVPARLTATMNTRFSTARACATKSGDVSAPAASSSEWR